MPAAAGVCRTICEDQGRQQADALRRWRIPAAAARSACAPFFELTLTRWPNCAGAPHHRARRSRASSSRAARRGCRSSPRGGVFGASVVPRRTESRDAVLAAHGGVARRRLGRTRGKTVLRRSTHDAVDRDSPPSPRAAVWGAGAVRPARQRQLEKRCAGAADRGRRDSPLAQRISLTPTLILANRTAHPSGRGHRESTAGAPFFRASGRGAGAPHRRARRAPRLTALTDAARRWRRRCRGACDARRATPPRAAVWGDGAVRPAHQRQLEKRCAGAADRGRRDSPRTQRISLLPTLILASRPADPSGRGLRESTAGAPFSARPAEAPARHTAARGEHSVRRLRAARRLRRSMRDSAARGGVGRRRSSASASATSSKNGAQALRAAAAGIRHWRSGSA